MKIRVKTRSAPGDYTIDIRRGALADIGAVLRRRLPDRHIVILTNHTVHALWFNKLELALTQAGITADSIVIRDGERYKNLRTYEDIISQLTARKIDRRAVLVAFGGGVIGDIGGLVAATYMRGIDLVHIPTTLISQIDSSIGGKTAVDHSQAKNLIGCFYNPRLVLTDPDILSTLPRREFINGLFEAIKIALVSNKSLYQFILNNVSAILERRPSVVKALVARCSREKAAIVSRDPYDHGRRAILNFGHTTGHALETSGRYRKLSHGEAVGWGMLVALKISEVKKYRRAMANREIESLIRRLLGKKQPGQVNPDALWEIMKRDKKARDGNVHFVLLKAIGRPVVEPVDRRLFTRALKSL